MANDLNRVMLVGRLVKDPDLRYIPSGTSVASFSIANNRSYVKNGEKSEQVSYFECIAWGKLGEIISQYCKKGKLIGVDGRLQQRSWDDKDGNKRYKVEVVVENFQFLSPAEGGGQFSSESYNNQGGAGVPTPAAGGSMPDADDNPFSDDDIPF
jgi:single-strand DNA-binding protein